MSLEPEILFLLKKVNDKYGQPVRTANEYEKLSEKMLDDAGVQVSASTLKRLWGKVGDMHDIRPSTCDCLSRYLGYKNFEEFKLAIRTDSEYCSAFFSAKTLESSELQPGQRIEIGWMPDRRVELQFLGGDSYRVTASVHSKLHVGDEFEVLSFMLGHPLYISRIKRGDAFTESYEAGRQGGLSILNLL
jgi:hypothetical protein